MGQTSEMTSDMVSLCAGCSTVLPLASKTEIVCTLSSDMVVAQVIIKCLRVGRRVCAIKPETFVDRRLLCIGGKISSHWCERQVEEKVIRHLGKP